MTIPERQSCLASLSTAIRKSSTERLVTVAFSAEADDTLDLFSFLGKVEQLRLPPLFKTPTPEGVVAARGRTERQLSSSEPEEASDLVSTDDESEGELLGGDTVDVEAESASHGKRVLLCNLRNSNLIHFASAFLDFSASFVLIRQE